MEDDIYCKHLIRSFMGIDNWEHSFHSLMNIIWLKVDAYSVYLVEERI